MPTLKYIDGVGQAGYLPVRAPVVSINGKTGVLEYDILKPYCTLSKIKPYLYYAGFLTIDYDNAKSYFESHDIPASGACSAVRNGNLYGRNFDWTYDESVSFVADIPRCGNRFASIAIAGAIDGLTEESMSGDIEDAMKLVPFFTQDGINEYGLTVSTLVVPSEGDSNVSVPTVEQRDSICSIMLVRYILDHFKTAHEAIDYISKYVSVWFPSRLHEMDYEQHYMLSDGSKTYILEFVNNAAVEIDISDKPYATNFLINDVIFNEDGSVFTPATLSDGSPTEDNAITDHGSGLERYNLIVDGYSDCGTAEGMRSLLNALKYTRSYSTSSDPANPYWYTEFVGGDLHCDSPISAFSEAVAEAGEEFESRERDGKTWQTVHSVVYDISAKTMSLITQEDGVELIFDLGELYERVTMLEEGKADKFQLPIIADELPEGYKEGLWVDTSDDSVDPAVRWDAYQTLTTEQKKRARDNISAIGAEDLDGAKIVVDAAATQPEFISDAIGRLGGLTFSVVDGILTITYQEE